MKLATHDLYDDICIWHIFVKYYMNYLYILNDIWLQGTDGALPRCKPFKYTYEKEIVMYAYFKNLDYFSTECIYSPNAYR